MTPKKRERMKISKNFSIEEFSYSPKAIEYGIINQITTSEQRDAIFALVRKVLQPLRDLWGKPIHINSGYRCPQLNARVGGVATSQHTKGEAADLKTGYANASYKMAKLILETPELWKQVDQLILYPTFIHVSHKRIGKQRQQLLYDKTYKGKRL